MNRQTKATYFSLLVHVLFLWGAFTLSQHAQVMRPPVVLDFSVLAPAGPAENSQQAMSPTSKHVQPSIPPVEKKIKPKPVVKKTPQPQTMPLKNPPPAEKTPPVDAVPVAASTDASIAQDSASSTETVPPSSPITQAPGSGQTGGGGNGGLFRVGQLDGPLTVLAKTPPTYPPAAKRQNIEGWIKVKFVVDEHGQVGHISVLAAEPEGIFEQSVLRCVSNWRFKPSTVRGMVVKALVEQTITFKLEG